MSPEEQDKAFKKAVKITASERAAIQKDTAGEVVRLLNLAGTEIEKKLKAQPSEYAAWYLPQVKKQIEQTLHQFGVDAGVAASAGQSKAWDAGQNLIDKPFAAAQVEIAAILPKLDTGQLLAMQTFLTGKMQDVALDTLNRVNDQLALTMIGSQGVGEAISGIQEVMGGISRRRAQTIVRTELGRAFSTASQLRSEQAAERVPGLKKQWRRSGKIHSRKSHDLTDGQVRPVDKPFILGTGKVSPEMESAVGPTRIMYPHDPAAPARETINCGCISLPYMDAWAEDGALALPGKKPFSAEEIALNPLKQEIAEGPTLAEIDKQVAAAKQAKQIKTALKALAKEEGKAQLARSMAKLDAKIAAYQLQEALAGKLGKWFQQAAKKLPETTGKTLEELAAEFKKDYQTKAAITGYKKAILAGKSPTKLQLDTISAISLEQQAAIDAELKIALDQQAAAAQLAAAAKADIPIPAARLDAVATTEIRDWTQVGPQSGSNPGGLFEALDGGRWYVKFPQDAARAHNEVLAAKLYKQAGIDVPEIRLVTKDGKVGVASRIIEGLERDAAALQSGKVQGVAEGFGMDAWLANWDVIGLGYDNLMVKAGRAWRIDVGGSLLYRAQGGAKGAAFREIVSEIDSLRDPRANAQAAAVFGKLSEAQIKASVARVLALDDGVIRRTVLEFSSGELGERSALADLLIARKANLASTYPDILPKIAEARRVAVEMVQGSIRASLAELDSGIVTAIKGIASRAKAGAALEAKDLARVSAAVSRFAEILDNADALQAASLEAVKAHYAPWLERLQQAVASGAGAKAQWGASGTFGGFDAAGLAVDSSKVSPAFAPFLFGEGAKYTATQVKTVLRAVEKHFGRKDYLGKATIPRHGPEADAFDTMPSEYKRALWSWTPSHIYRAVNEELLAAAKEGRKPAQPVQDYADLLNDALKNAPDERRHVGESARGMFYDDADATAFFAKMKAIKDSRGAYQFEGFASSTVGDTPGFSGTRLWVHIKGKSGIHINSISSYAGSENEVLFGTETQFRVTNIKQKDGRYHVYLEEI